ncbi:MAG: amidohydrolase family protein [Bacteroidota bacterium]
MKKITYKLHTLFITAFLFMPIYDVLAQNPTPARNQTKSILITGVTVHNGINGVYNNASVGFKDGKITYLSYVDQSTPAWDSIIDAKGKHVYPGIIALNTYLGLSEIEAVRAMNDYAEVGSINPGVRSIIAYNTDSKITPTIRSNGILLAQITPQGGVVSGTSSVVQLDAWNWEDAAYLTDDGIHINWPSMRVYYGENNQEDFEKKQREKINKELQQLEMIFADAYAYHMNPSPEVKNLHLEAMRGLFNGKKRLYIHADYVKEIMAAISLCNKYKLTFTLVGGANADLVLNLLKEHNVSVIVGRTHSLPPDDDHDIDAAYKLPKKLQDAGILYALSCDGFWQVRNLPFMAGTAAAWGLSKEQALSSITFNAAKILGIDKSAGSIEKGKDAHILICEGDLLDMKSSQINAAFISGRMVNLDNIQHQLYKKYKSKYGLK